MFPVIFIGHGSPMNAIEDNEYTRGWQQIAASIPKPTAILCISAHWVTQGTKVLTQKDPKIIYDFYGFPQELYEVIYKAKGAPKLAKETQELVGAADAKDDEWGIDHGTWSVLNIMYPKADIPVYQMSIDDKASPQELFEIGNKIKPLRDKNVLILGSGNIVHNLRMIDFNMEGGFDWAYDFDNFIKDKIVKREYASILNYREMGNISRYSVPTTEHFNPLLYILGSTDVKDEVHIYNNLCMGGSLSMTSYVFT